MSGVDVTVDGVTITSDFDGLALFEGYAPGNYDYSASKAGYITQTGSVTVIDENIMEFISLPLEHYDVLVWCTDETTTTNLADVMITLDGVLIETDTNGLAWYHNITVGEHEYTASREGYESVAGNIIVTNSNVALNLALNPIVYDMMFWCTEEGNPMGMSGVDVTIDGVTVSSDFDGLAIFESYTPGEYNYTASKDGYLTQNGIVNLIDGNIEEFIVLDPVYYVNFVINDGREPIEGAEISFAESVQYTDENGEAVFNNIISGNYVYSISMEGYIIDEGHVDVENNDVNIEISLVVNGLNAEYFEQTSVYPNPSNGKIFIDFAGTSKVQIFNQEGAIIFNGYINNDKTSIDLQDNPAGLYHIILNHEGYVYSHKILIIK